MEKSNSVPKKRGGAVSKVTGPHCVGNCFTVTAKLLNQNCNFLVDSGADVSALPPSFKRHAFPFDIKLSAANKTAIKTYGCVTTNVVFPNLQRCYKADFIVAEVAQPILGADFFKAHKLLIDVSDKCLIDKVTGLSVNLKSSDQKSTKISALSKIDQELLNVLHDCETVFDVNAPRPTPNITFTIDNTSIPKPSRPYRLSPDKVQAAREEIQREISLGRMHRSDSQYSSPFFPVKKPDGTWRFVADYTKLNAVTTKDNYTPPMIDDLLARIPRNCIFSKIDLQKAFFLIPIAQEDQHKTAVITPFGLYEYKVMPMGLKNASQTLQRYVDTVLAGSINTIAYCDDILLFSDEHSHLKELSTLLHKLHHAGLVVNRQKSSFMQTHVTFLGHDLNPTGCRPSVLKIEALQSYAIPKNVKQVRRFLGMTNFYRKFIPNCAELHRPLTELTCKNVKFEWSENCQSSFTQLLLSLANATELTYLSPEDKYTLTTDASGTAVGGVLSSQHGPIGFFSKVFKDAEQNYCTYDKELSAVYKSVKHFEWLLFGMTFTLRVDHKPLLNMLSKTSDIERRRRQVEYLSAFDFSVEYIPGKENIVADALSRDKAVDAITLHTDLTDQTELRRLQESDDDIMNIAEEHRKLHNNLWYDCYNRLLVPTKFRLQITETVHCLAHSNITSTLKQIQTSYVWPKIRNMVSKYVRSCNGCQSGKVTRHCKPPFKSYGSNAKFEAIHVDFVGPLPRIKNKQYLFTIFDRATRWLAAYPVSNQSAETATNCLINWVSLFGVPATIVSDQGTSFESTLFKSVTAKLGIKKCRTTAYHPAPNAVERQHRRLKQALKARSNNAAKTWLTDLPLVLLGLNNAISDDTDCSAAFATFGRQLSIPGCVFDNNFGLSDAEPERRYTRHDAFVPQQLKSCTHVWLRRGIPCKNLQRPYIGPYKVINRNFENHTMTIEVNGAHQLVTMERVKPHLQISILTANNHAAKTVTFC